MELILTSTGGYPRIGDMPEEQALRKTIAEWEKGEKTGSDLRIAEDDITKRAIKEQINAGLDLVTDGLVRWYDPISHIAGKMEGVEIKGLLRFFDTNFYFRQPSLDGPIRRSRPIIINEFLFAKAVSEKPVKPVITGPYTLAKLSDSGSASYAALCKITENFTVEMLEEIRELSEAGAEVIQIDEPAITKYPGDYEIFREAILAVNSVKGKSKLALYTYFGDVAPLYDEFQMLPVDILGMDFTYSRDLTEIIFERGSVKPLGLGLIDGRNTKPESRKQIVRILDRVIPKIESGVSYLNPSCGLEYLPRDKAFEKLRIMSAVRKEFFKS